LLDEEQSAGRDYLEYHPQYTRRDWVAGTKASPSHAAIRSGNHARADEGARGEGETKVSFEVGEIREGADGPFQNQTGVVEEIDPERGKLRVSVTIFVAPRLGN